MKKTPKKQTHPVMMLVFFLFAVGCIAALFFIDHLFGEMRK